MYALNLTMGNFIEAPTAKELKAEIRRNKWVSGRKSDIWRIFRYWEDMQDFYVTHGKHLHKLTAVNSVRQEFSHKELESNFEIEDAPVVYVAEYKLHIEAAHSTEDMRRIIGVYHDRDTAEKELRSRMNSAMRNYGVQGNLHRMESDYSNSFELSYFERKDEMTFSILGNAIEMTVW